MFHGCFVIKKRQYIWLNKYSHIFKVHVKLLYFLLAIRIGNLVRIGMDISVFSYIQSVQKKFRLFWSLLIFAFLLDRNGLLSCAERSAQWPILAPQAISQSLWQPSRSSGFLDLKHLSPPTHELIGKVCSWWSRRSTEHTFFCGDPFIEVGGKKVDLLVFKKERTE